MPSEGYTLNLPEEPRFGESDLIKIWVISSFVMISVLVTIYAFSTPSINIHPTLMFLFPQLYYIPIILISLWYPRYGLQCTVLLVGAFLAITSYFYYLGTPVDPFVSGVNAAMYLWVVVATTQLVKEGGILNLKYLNVFRNAGAGIFLCNSSDLTIVDANEKLADILGYEASKLRGLPASELWADRVEGETFFKECDDAGTIPDRKVRFLSNSGDIRTIQLSSRKNRDPGIYECTAIDISSREAEQADLMESKERLQHLINSSQDVIFMQDASGRFLQFHWAKAADYGIEPPELIGSTASCLFPDEVVTMHRQYVDEVMATGKTFSFEFGAPLGGADRLFSVMLGPVHNEAGTPMGVIGTMRDISLQGGEDRNVVQLERELDRWRNFINTAAHELRTPLQPILGYLHLILENPSSYALDSETVKLLQLCLENVERERRVVDRMLELGIMDSCNIALNTSEILLRQFVGTVVRIGGYDLKAEISVDISHDATIIADRDRIYHVIDGLISNAVQYSDLPRKVWISYEGDETDHYIRVRDNGRGIAPEALEDIFEPFYLADMENLSREYGRMGLGLSISQRYIEVHGGEIIVQSAVGIGSLFVVRIPREVGNVA